jgi:hypothetical protein
LQYQLTMVGHPEKDEKVNQEKHVSNPHGKPNRKHVNKEPSESDG